MIRRKPHVLFVCTANKERSPTAELMYADDPRFEVRSAGVSPYATRPVDARLLHWADWVIAMEDDHVRELEERFPAEVQDTHIVSLDIPDIYSYRSLTLMREIRDKFGPLAEKIAAGSP